MVLGTLSEMGTKTKFYIFIYIYIFFFINYNITANISSINECINKCTDLGLSKPNIGFPGGLG